MATDFKYAAQTDLEMYYPSYSQFDAKRQLFGWVESTSVSDQYIAHNCGLVTQLFKDGSEQASVQTVKTDVTANGRWFYHSGEDALYFFDSNNNPRDLIMEGGIDNSTYFNQMLVNASMELNNLLDRRYATPIPKYTQYDANNTRLAAAPEYDALIIKSTCYLCVANLLRTNNRQEEGDYYNNLVTNAEGSGLIDRLNKGEYKLSFEVDSKDSRGKPRGTPVGSMDIIETGGAYVGEPYDIIKIQCTTAGAYGAAKVKVVYYGNDKLFGSEKTNITVTGGLQHIHGGWYCRFQGATMNEDDIWEIEVFSETRKITNAESGGIQLTRRGYGI